MRQRNDTGHGVDVAAYPDEEHPDRHPFTVGPGEVVEFPELLGGFTEVPGEEPAESDAEPAAKTRKRASAAPVPEGVES
jgi:hypothetical protein